MVFKKKEPKLVKPSKCLTCGGSGLKDSETSCPVCEGTGKLIVKK